jgi:chromosome segregation ATPase
VAPARHQVHVHGEAGAAVSVDKLKDLLAVETAARDRLVEYRMKYPSHVVGQAPGELEEAYKAAHDAVDAWIEQEKAKADLQRALDQMTRERDAAQRQVTDLDNRLTALTLMSEGLERERDTAAREIDAMIQRAKDWEANTKNLGAALAGVITEKNDLSYKLGIAAARLMEYCERIVDERGQLIESNEHKHELVNRTLERAAQVADEDIAQEACKIAKCIRALKGTT